MSRLLKQLIYGSAYLAIIAALAVWVYFSYIYAAPSCFDGIQNQDEEGVDCGGSCPQTCLPSEFESIETIDRIRVLKIDDERSSLLAKIQNNNLDFSAESFDYAFNIFDKSDNLIRSIYGSSYIYQGEIKYIAVPNFKIPQKQIARVELEISNPKWVAGEKLVRPDIVIQNQTTNLAENQVKVEGRLVNQDLFAVRSVKVVAVFYGQFGLPVGVSQTEIENLLPGSSRSFVINHKLLDDILTDKTKIFVYAKR